MAALTLIMVLIGAGTVTVGLMKLIGKLDGWC